MSPRVFPLKVIHHLCCPPSPPPSTSHWIASCLVSLISDLIPKHWLPTSDTILAPHIIHCFDPIKKKIKKKTQQKTKTNQPKTKTQTNPQNSSTYNLSSKVKFSGILFLIHAHCCGSSSLSAPEGSGCNTRSKHTQDREVFPLHLGCARKARLISDWTGMITTYLQPPNLKACWQAYFSLMLTPHVIPWSSMCQSCPCRQEKLLEHLAPALPLSVLSPKHCWHKAAMERPGFQAKNTLGRD